MNVLPTVPLAAVASFVRGITFKPEDVLPIGSPGSAACMRTKNVQTDIDLTDVWGIPLSFVRRQDQFLQAGDLLVSSANSWNLVGKCCWVPDLPWKATFGGFVSVLRSDHRKVDARYLYHWFASARVQRTVRSFGQQTTNLSNLNIERCLNFALPLPSMKQQRRIAEILDKADTLRARRRAALAQLQTLAQVVFLDMFGGFDSSSTIGDLLQAGVLLLHKDGNHGSLYPRADDFTEDGVPFLSAKSVSDGGGIDSSKIQRLRREKAQDLKIGWVQTGDVLLAHNASVGKVALYDGRLGKALIGTSLTAFRPNPEALDSRYLAAALRSAPFQCAIEMNMAQTTRNQVPITAQRELTLPMPPVMLQREFARRVAATDTLKAIHHSASVQLDELFASLQHRAFRGEL
jgi:type I restriction enzyme S subunit